MHMADALVAPAVAATMYGLTTASAGVSIHNVRKEEDFSKVPVMGVMGAFVFAAQMLNFTIPGTGSSGHLCGAVLLSAVLGPSAGFLTMVGVLLIQCLLFADGGILALGCNIWNMAFYGCFLAVGVIWKPMMKNGAGRIKIIAASMLGCIISLQLGAFSVVLETVASGITELPFSLFVSTMQPIHLAIGAVEGVITSAVLLFVYEARPELLWGIGSHDAKNRLSGRAVLIVFAAASVLCAGIVSLFASAKPDGLEWSLEKVAGSMESDMAGEAYETAAKIQDTTALLPDYALKNSDSALGTSLSGLVGLAVLIALSVLTGIAVKLVKRHKGKRFDDENRYGQGQ